MRESKLRINKSNDDVGPLLSEKQVIERLGLQDRKKPKASLKWLRRSGQLGFVRIGRGIHAYPESEIQRFIREKYQEPA